MARHGDSRAQRGRRGRTPPATPTDGAAGERADGRAHGRADGRVRRSRERVLRATAELLGESGVGGVSVDEVARRSGVAKTTIYRHWPTRAELVIDACSQLSADLEVPDTGGVEGDLTALLATVADLLRTARWSSVLPSIVDAAERDPDLAGVHRRIQRGHAAPVRAVLARAVGRGELPPGVDPAAMTAELLGPLFYRRWFSREALDAPFVRRVVRDVLRAHGAALSPA